MTPAQASVEVVEVTDDDLRRSIANALASAGLTLEELQDQARRSRFSSEEARFAWFIVSSLHDRV